MNGYILQQLNPWHGKQLSQIPLVDLQLWRIMKREKFARQDRKPLTQQREDFDAVDAFIERSRTRKDREEQK